MTPCDCHDRPDFFDLFDGELDGFLMGFIVGRRREEYRLYTCSECGTIWIVDDCTRCHFAVRATSEADLDNFDERPFRRSALIAMHGGYANEKCAWQGCDQLALKGLAICVDHKYPELAT